MHYKAFADSYNQAHDDVWNNFGSPLCHQAQRRNHQKERHYISQDESLFPRQKQGQCLELFRCVVILIEFQIQFLRIQRQVALLHLVVVINCIKLGGPFIVNLFLHFVVKLRDVQVAESCLLQTVLQVGGTLPLSLLLDLVRRLQFNL